MYAVMYAITGKKFIFSISLLILSVKIQNWKMSLLAPISGIYATPIKNLIY